jgi:hypothetical protein
MIRLMIGWSSRAGAVRRVAESVLKAAVTGASFLDTPSERIARRAGLGKRAVFGKSLSWA